MRTKVAQQESELQRLVLAQANTRASKQVMLGVESNTNAPSAGTPPSASTPAPSGAAALKQKLTTKTTRRKHPEMMQYRDLEQGDKVRYSVDQKGRYGEVVNTVRKGGKFNVIFSGPSDNDAIQTQTWAATEELLSNKGISLVVEKVKAGVSFDSVILDKSKKDQINAAIAQVDHHDLIFNQWGFADVFEKGTAVSMLFHGPPGTGKGNPLTEPILTPDGFVPMGSIVPGSQVIGADGCPTKVERIFPLGDKEVYKVTLSDNAVLRVTDEHLWQVRRKGKSMVVDTNELEFGDQIPLISKPVEYNTNQEELPIDPWVLGALLGDGSFRPGGSLQFTTGNESIVAEMKTRLSKGVRLYSRNKLQHNLIGDGFDEPVSGQPPLRYGIMWRKLADLGLKGCHSYNKFIPDVYLYGSLATRIQVLQGLLDTDGNGRGGNAIEYGTTSTYLRDGVMELVRSLGGIAWVTRVDDRPKNAHPCYIIRIQMPPEFKTFLASGKTYGRSATRPTTRRVASIELDGVEACQCIYVEASDHLYVAGDYVVSHNTLMAQAIADKYHQKLKIISTAEIQTPEPGGAERNIQKAFDDAKDGKTLLLFDECNGLITDRSRVGMILVAQINSLLTGLEKYTGIAVFTTNRLEALDPAFDRRLSLKLEFPMPDAEHREKIWQRMFPKQAPLAPDIRWADLASIEIAGGHIKNVVLKAARLAATTKAKLITDEILWECLEKRWSR